MLETEAVKKTLSAHLEEDPHGHWPIERLDLTMGQNRKSKDSPATQDEVENKLLYFMRRIPRDDQKDRENFNSMIKVTLYGLCMLNKSADHFDRLLSLTNLESQNRTQIATAFLTMMTTHDPEWCSRSRFNEMVDLGGNMEDRTYLGYTIEGIPEAKERMAQYLAGRHGSIN